MNAIVRIAPKPDDVTAISDDMPITAKEVQERLTAASNRIGEGHFALTFNAGSDNATFVTHHFPPWNCKYVGSGTLRHCLDAVDAYASRWVAEHATVPAVAAE